MATKKQLGSAMLKVNCNCGSHHANRCSKGYRCVKCTTIHQGKHTPAPTPTTAEAPKKGSSKGKK